MSHKRLNAALTLVLISLFVSKGFAAIGSAEQTSAEQAVAKVLKEPASAKFGTFSLAGPRGACLTVYKKNWQTLGASEAFLLRKDGGWEVVYVADVPSGHQGCIDEMTKR